MRAYGRKSRVSRLRSPASKYASLVLGCLSYQAIYHARLEVGFSLFWHTFATPPLQRPGHLRVRAFLACVFSSRLFSGDALLRVELLACLYVSGGRRLLRVEQRPSASGDLLRVARKSDSLRFRWVYRTRRDRSHRVLLDTRPFGVLFRLV